MATIAFVSYEIHPTTWGGAGVLLHHSAMRLLEAGHRVVFLLDVPKQYFDRFDQQDRLTLPNADACVAYHVDALVGDLAVSEREVANAFLWKSLRFDSALARVLETEAIDFVEFFEYCGVAHYALVAKLFGRRHAEPIVGMRVHNSVELIDAHESTKALDRERYLLYALERAGLARSEATLFPSRRYAEAYYYDRYAIREASAVVSQSPTQPFGRRSGFEGERDEVVYLGRVFEFKGVETLVRAAVQFCEDERRHGRAAGRPELRFVFIGSDSKDAIGGTSYTEYLRGTIPEAHLHRFEFTGHMDHDAVLARLARARFAVLPNRFESFCYAAHELYDAGVPLIANDIPAFQNYWEDDKNALIFDGSVDGLVAAMARLNGDEALRERLSRPYPVATEPLGPYYDAPYPGIAIPDAGATHTPPRVLCIVRSRAARGAASERATLDAIDAASEAPDRVVVAREVKEAAHSAARWLGGLWSFEERNGEAVAVNSLCSLDAIWLLEAGDLPGPEMLSLCRAALARTASLGFAGTWTRGASGDVDVSVLDIAPELHPFEYGARLTRALIRTAAARPLSDVFDVRAGSYGESALCWQAQQRYGPGAVLPEVQLTRSATEALDFHAEHLAFLVTTLADARMQQRLAAHAVVAHPASSHVSLVDRQTSARPPSFDEVLALASEHLNGRSLLGLALAKLRAKLGLPGKR